MLSLIFNLIIYLFALFGYITELLSFEGACIITTIALALSVTLYDISKCREIITDKKSENNKIA